MLGLRDILLARDNLQGIIARTALIRSATFSKMAGADVYLKTENLQKTGSFKIRGASNKIAKLDAAQKSRGVVTASAGNHAQGVALAAAKAGIEATIVMPLTTPLAKAMATEGYGARVVLSGQNYDEACQKAAEIREKTGAVFIHAFDDEDVIAGQGTIGLEILEELPAVDLIFIPIGGGGLASGIAVAVKKKNPRVRIIGVEAAGAASYKASREKGCLCELTSVCTIADGIAVKRPGRLTYDLLAKYLDDVVTVDDEEIAAAVLMLLERGKLVTEGSGAVSVAAIIYQKHVLRGKTAVAVISGGNIDVNYLSIIIEKGLIKTGRHISLTTVMPDKPGNLQVFLEVIARERGNIIAVNHDRSRLDLPLGMTLVEAVVETAGPKESSRIYVALKKEGFILT